MRTSPQNPCLNPAPPAFVPEPEPIIPPESRILVTGASGFLGARVVAGLLRRGHRNVRCFVRPSSQRSRLETVTAGKAPDQTVELVVGDLACSEDCRRAMEGVAVALHLAAGFEKSVADVRRNSAEATRLLVEAGLETGGVRRFVLVSSFAVYSNAGLARRALLDEDCPLEAAPERRHDAYTMGKLWQERIVRDFALSRGLPFVVLRPGAVFGPGKTGLTGRLGIRLGKVFLDIGGNNPLPLTYVDNCAEAVVLAGLRPGVEGQTFNVVDDDLPTCGEFLRAYRKRAGGLLAVRVPYAAAFAGCALLEAVSRVAPGFPKRFNRARARAEWKGNQFTNARLRAWLGWTPRVPMSSALREFLGQFGPPGGGADGTGVKVVSAPPKAMGVAVVGCGNVAPFYCNSLPRHTALRLAGVMDRDGRRAEAFARYYSVRRFGRLEDVLNDASIGMVLNLTNPRSHFEVSRAALLADKHVYSEKPLAMNFDEARHLVELARERGLRIASAPSRLLAETAQTLWKALRENVAGKVRAVYAEMDGGLIARSHYREWVNELGMPWPYHDEFAAGCTVEHAGYPVSWLTAFFGPVEEVLAAGFCQVPEIAGEAGVASPPSDLTVACLRFRSGVVARLTTSWLAPHDHSIRVFGDTGVLSTKDVWAPRSPVFVTRNRYIRLGPKRVTLPWRSRYPFAEPPKRPAGAPRLAGPKAVVRALRARFLHLRKRVDFCLGPAELAASVFENRPCRLPPDYCLHNTEIVLAIHNASAAGARHRMTTSFEPLQPMPWAGP